VACSKVNFTFPKSSSRWFLPVVVHVGEAVLAVADMVRVRTAWDLMAEGIAGGRME